MSRSLTSPEVLQALWGSYCTYYRSKKGKNPSKSKFCEDLGWDRSALSKWMKPDTPSNRRIPLERIPVLATALMLSSGDEDKLMSVRVRELIAADPSLRTALKWVERKARQREALRRHLDTDEQRVLATYREAAANYPRGLYGDGGESGMLLAQMQVLLERAEVLHIEEAVADGEPSPDLFERKQRVLATVAAHQAATRAFEFADAKKRAREGCDP